MDQVTAGESAQNLILRAMQRQTIIDKEYSHFDNANSAVTTEPSKPLVVIDSTINNERENEKPIAKSGDSAYRQLYPTAQLQELQNQSATDSPIGRKARFAALASAIDKFEYDAAKSSPCIDRKRTDAASSNTPSPKVHSTTAKKVSSPNTVHIRDAEKKTPEKKKVIVQQENIESPRPSTAIAVITNDAIKSKIRNLRVRWEVSSATGIPLHPDQNDDLLDAAARIVKFKNAPLNTPRTGRRVQHIAHDNQSPKNVEKCILSDEKTQKNSATTLAKLEDETVEDAVAVTDGISDAMEEEEIEEEDDEEAEKAADEDKLIDTVFDFIRTADMDVNSTTEPDIDRIVSTGAIESAKLNNAENTGSSLLPHSVSFYRNVKNIRKQQMQTANVGTNDFRLESTLRQATKDIGRSDNNRQLEHAQFENNIKLYNDAINVQQEQILQASRALSICHETQAFYGSREEVETQRALLLATERRRALIYELERITVAHRENRSTSDKGPSGTLTISHITLRLNRDFINAHVNYSGELFYYFIVLITHRDQVLATQMVTSDDGLQSGSLEFDHYIQLKNLPHDFSIMIDVFALRTKREIMSHEEKYKLKSASGLKKIKGAAKAYSSSGYISPSEARRLMDPSFQKVGSLHLNLNGVNRGKFLLSDIHYPIDGAIFIKLRCFANSSGGIVERGFLSIFQEVSGLGSWTRLWCVLADGAMRFWRYPDDEQKEALISIDLNLCTNRIVALISKEECPRAHTIVFDILNVNEQKPSRVLLSADNRVDCQKWLSSINSTLANLRLWTP